MLALLVPPNASSWYQRQLAHLPASIGLGLSSSALILCPYQVF